MTHIITRFAPSPTGYLHVGGARTALFNWFYARHMKGKFILRIEDTDTVRSTQASVDAIFDALNWLEIDWDEGPHFQSQRFDIYETYVQKLIETGHAYYCSCSPEKLDEMRKRAMETGGKPKYDGTCREKGLAPGENTVVRFKAPAMGTTVLNDVIKGGIVFQNSELDDFIIRRSDGTPTYNFVVVVDDISMGVNTILRGDDHVNNTPRQIQLYQALGAALPVFGHLPMVLGPDRTRLSKRHGATSVTAYRDMGVLPEALTNYLIRLGWSHGDQEFFTRNELIEKFSIEHIGKSAGIFDMAKLMALNADHIKAAPVETLSRRLLPHLDQRGCEAQEGTFLQGVIRTLNTRSKTLEEMADGALFYYQNPVSFDEKAAAKFLVQESLAPLTAVREMLSGLSAFDEAALEEGFKRVIDETGLKLGKIAQPLRVALTGKTVSPGIFEIIAVLGKENTFSRIDAALALIPKTA
jgi:glutamyl-tRNA synthetase